MVAIRPIAQASCRLQSGGTGVEDPELLSRRCIQRDDLLCGREGEQRTPDDERIGLQAALFLGVERPRYFKRMHVATIDLAERGVMISSRLAAIDRPILM